VQINIRNSFLFSFLEGAISSLSTLSSSFSTSAGEYSAALDCFRAPVPDCGFGVPDGESCRVDVGDCSGIGVCCAPINPVQSSRIKTAHSDRTILTSRPCLMGQTYEGRTTGLLPNGFRPLQTRDCPPREEQRESLQSLSVIPRALPSESCGLALRAPPSLTF